MSDIITRPIGMVVQNCSCSGCVYDGGTRCKKPFSDGTGCCCSIDREDETGVIFQATGEMGYSALRDLYAEKQAELDNTCERLNGELAALDVKIRAMDGGEIVERENEHLLNGVTA